MLVAVAVFLVLGGGLAALFVVVGGDENDLGIDISAADWVGTGKPDGGAAVTSSAGEPDENGQPAEGYAPPDATEPEPDQSDESGHGDGDANQEGRVVKKGEVRSGVPVIKSLSKIGLSARDSQILINSLKGVFDFRKARPGHKFEVHLDEQSGTPVYFRYEVSIVDIYEVRKQGSEFKGRKKVIPTKKRTRRFGGTIASSLYAALKALDAHPALAGRIVEVLSTQVNFYKEQRPGDTFRVLVEEETYADTFLGYGPVLALEYNGVKAGKKRFFRFAAGSIEPTYYSEKGVSVPRSVISIPLHYTRISSPFGVRYHPVLKRRKLHNGVDFAAATGTAVWACKEGEVTIADTRGANGKLVAIEHEDGLESYYAHLSRFASGIKQGVKVRKRQVIGYVGSTGRSTGPHLHFGLKRYGKFIDPLKYKIQPGRPAPPKHRPALKKLIANRGDELDRTPIKAPDAPLAKVPEAGSEVLGLEEDL
ncbi:MAG: M23 family metallopeptidase [Deltaproteobacteria bacterium]|nr:M23 family metallopeptidase [Deltaproteobacteria bacterium]